MSGVQVPQLAATVFLLTAAVGAAAAEPITGRASVIDADTIELHGARIRLSGIDAPEGSQTCTARAAGKPIPCGRQAPFFLADMIEGKTVTCTADGTDRYKRILAHCSIGGVDSVAPWCAPDGR